MTAFFLATALAAVVSGAGPDRPDADTPDFSGPRSVRLLLANPGVREQLKLDAIQEVLIVSHVESTDRQFQEHSRRLQARPPGQPNDEAGDPMAEIEASTRRLIEEALKPDQALRLRQIRLHDAGPAAFQDPEVEKALELSAEQQQEICRILGEVLDPREFVIPHDRARTILRRRELRRYGIRKILSRLTSEQRERFEELIGPPFELKIPVPQRPGPPA